MVKLRDRLVDHGALSHLRNIACSLLVTYRDYPKQEPASVTNNCRKHFSSSRKISHKMVIKIKTRKSDKVAFLCMLSDFFIFGVIEISA